jgi:translocator protein
LQEVSAQGWLTLGFLLVLVFAVGWFGSFVTLPKIPNWYAGLRKPSFTPPPWVFGPAWSLLYLLMAIAAWRVWLLPEDPSRDAALLWFAVQLAVNAAWSPVFFGMERPDWALAVLTALLISLSITVIQFFKLDPMAGWMLVPYLAWVIFATVLNIAIVTLNRSPR